MTARMSFLLPIVCNDRLYTASLAHFPFCLIRIRYSFFVCSSVFDMRLMATLSYINSCHILASRPTDIGPSYVLLKNFCGV
jgi:hypothetical protein